ncbi:MAG: beta-galactosidase [Chloroflexota bacterium]|nr:beta-galactosidase [Chloroflexota bacterium]
MMDPAHNDDTERKLQPLHLGAAYYPEHWPEERWPEDVALMQRAGFSVARLGEFAWSTLEPDEGEFDFDWLDRAITLLADHGIATVLGTPTAAPPAWLISRYPDILPIDDRGQQVQFGNRTHYCVNSPQFHRAAARIAENMGRHFGANPQVIGWQLDNEYSRICYCDHCRQVFQNYLRERFDTLDALNERWSTRYWSQTYSDWFQIPLPIGDHNPGLRLAFQQFITESYRRFQQVQLAVLCPHLPDGIWVTHNFMKWFDGYDHYILSEDLDLASWDWYVSTGHNDFRESGAAHDLVRGYKRKNFWLMETQPGSVNWGGINKALNRAETRLLAWHAVAHGADAILYWQWRSALGGQEQLHGTLVDQSGKPRPLYDEVRWIGHEFSQVGHLLAGSTIKSQVAILHDFDSRWSMQWQPHHRDFDYVEHLLHYYRPLAAHNVGVDILSADAELDDYRLVIVPALTIVTAEGAERLRQHVKRGGYLVLTLRTGIRDRYNALLPMRPPAGLTELAGVEVEEYFALEKPIPVEGNLVSGKAHIWAERITLLNDSSVVSMRFGVSNGWLDGQPAVTVTPHGRGMVYYFAAYLDETSQAKFMGHIARTALVRSKWKAPAGIEVARRVRPDGQEIWIALNHELMNQRLPLPWPAYDHLRCSRFDGELALGPYAVALLTQIKDDA